MTARQLHRSLALLLALFLSLHLAHHITLIGGTDTHLSIQAMISPLYRWLPVEALLLTLLALQIALGARLAWRIWPRAGGWRRVQAGSGLAVGAFILIHVGAVLTTRLQGLETTVHFAAAGLYHPLLRWFFFIYYPAGIVALMTHLAAHLAIRRIGPHWLPWALPTIASLYAIMVVTGLAGGFGGPAPSPEYLYPGSTLP